MTCIVAVKRADGGVTMAADRCIADDTDRQVMAEPKIFELGDLLIGAAGANRPGQVIQYQVHKLAAKLGKEDDPLKYLRTVFADEVARKLDENGCRWDPDGEHDHHEFALLIAVRGRIFTMDETLAVDEYREPFAAVGSGRMFAIGALAAWLGAERVASTPSVDLEWAKTFAAAALAISARYAPGVSGPFDLFHQDTPITLTGEEAA